MANMKYFISYLHLFLLNSSVISLHLTSSLDILPSEHPRVKRQAGYVYDKPNISFDLPTRPTTVSTQAPTVDRPKEQQMYYAYPAPAGGDTVNIGYSNTGSTAATSASAGGGAATGGSAGGGYNYQSQTTVTTGTQGSSLSGAAGYNYQTPATTTTGAQGSSGSGAAGYNYNVPTSTLGSVTETVSTNAPKYLPPISGGGSSSGVTSVNIPTGGGSTGSSVTSSTVTTTSSTSALPVPDTNYLPPLPVAQPSPRPNPVALPPASDYLPPSSGSPISPRQPPVSIPASTYLPPVL